MRGLRSRRLLGLLAIIAAALAMAALRGSMSRYQVDVAFTIFLYVALAQAWNILGGLGGQVSLGTSGFVGVGSYATALLMIHTGFGLVASILAAGAVAALCALALSVPLFRLRAAYFSIGTLALTLAAQAWFVNWEWAGATQGIAVPFELVPKPATLYLYALALAAVAMAAAWIVRNSDYGLRLMAIRDNEDAAGTLGVPAFRVKLVALVFTSFLIGLAGGLVAVHQVSIEPYSAFGLTWTINAVVMTVVGGVGTLLGPLIGVLVVYYGIQQQLESSPELSALLTGVLLVVIVRLAPEGLWGLARESCERLLRLVRERRSAAEVSPAPGSRPA